MQPHKRTRILMLASIGIITIGGCVLGYRERQLPSSTHICVAVDRVENLVHWKRTTDGHWTTGFAHYEDRGDSLVYRSDLPDGVLVVINKALDGAPKDGSVAIECEEQTT